MLEDILFGQLSMPGEAIRTFLAFFIVMVAAYFDVFNKKNIPDQVLYASLILAFLVNLFFYEATLFWFSLAVAAFFSAIGYLFYRIGQLGGADVIILASVMLLLPLHPSFVGMPFNVPFIFSVIIFSGVAFALYVLGYYSFKLLETEAKPNLMYGLMLIPYLLFAYVYVGSFLFSPVYFAFISILLFASIFFLMFRESLNMLLAEELPIAQLEPEDVLALEIMNKDMIERYKIKRMVTQAEIDRLKKTKVTEVWVYTRLPPFIPFILIGMVLAILFAKSLLLVG